MAEQRRSRVMSFKLFRPENRLTLENLLTPGQKSELDVRVAELDGRVQPTQGVAVGAGHFRLPQGIQDRLVVLIDQHDRALSRALVQRLDQMGEPFRGRRGRVRRRPRVVPCRPVASSGSCRDDRVR